MKAPAVFSHDVFLWNTDILIGDLGRVAGPDSHLAVKLVANDTLRVSGNDDLAETVVLLFLRLRDALGHHEIADGPVGDEHLVSVDDKVLSVFHGPRLVSRHIGSGIGFGEGTGGHPFPSADGGNILFLLLFRSKVVDRLTAETGSDDIQSDSHVHP